jgi:FdhE protein
MPRSFPEADPTAIGTVSAPPFAVLPDPSTLFAERAERLEFLAQTHELAPYLRFLAGIAAAQHRAAQDLPELEIAPEDQLARSGEHGMPLIERAGFRRDAVVDATLGRFFDEAAAAEMPTAATAALSAVRNADEHALDALINNVLADSVPIDDVAEHVFVGAALQIHFARLAARLPVKALKPVGETLCPACGGPPVSSMVVGWHGSESTRFCACPLCASQWHYVRIRCTACGSTKGVGYQSVEGGPDTVKAETCDECRSYTKIFYQLRDPAMDPVADDVASLGLDLLMKQGPYRRAGYNPYLIGY